MGISNKIMWGGLGWVLAGPIGGIIGYAMASMNEERGGSGLGGMFGLPKSGGDYPQTRAGDFTVSLLVLFGQVMKADKQLLKSELDYVKKFLTTNFGRDNARDLMVLFKDIIKQDYSLPTVCRQVKSHMDHPARLEMIHVLFGLSQSDGEIHPDEIDVIRKISGYLGVSSSDFDSIQAMFVKDTTAAYTILEIDPSANDQEIKRAYRKMAAKFHPDKVSHLGKEFQEMAEEKFKAISEAYEQIKKERSIT
ncbi:MAG: TerB family tellurite resistance protein [Candidatus Marinimicrobia bacterium]|nr:TerB family tellurite resistance protein [Candidatus Neomarinimicrobiota bacterium]